MMREDLSITLMNLMYVIAGTCQQGCRHLPARLLAYGSNRTNQDVQTK